MKFNKELKRLALPEWRLYFIDYKKLKQVIKRVTRGEAPASAFWTALRRECDKVKTFYAVKTRAMQEQERVLAGALREVEVVSPFTPKARRETRPRSQSSSSTCSGSDPHACEHTDERPLERMPSEPHDAVRVPAAAVVSRRSSSSSGTHEAAAYPETPPRVLRTHARVCVCVCEDESERQVEAEAHAARVSDEPPAGTELAAASPASKRIAVGAMDRTALPRLTRVSGDARDTLHEVHGERARTQGLVDGPGSKQGGDADGGMVLSIEARAASAAATSMHAAIALSMLDGFVTGGSAADILDGADAAHDSAEDGDDDDEEDEEDEQHPEPDAGEDEAGSDDELLDVHGLSDREEDGDAGHDVRPGQHQRERSSQHSGAATCIASAALVVSSDAPAQPVAPETPHTRPETAMRIATVTRRVTSQQMRFLRTRKCVADLMHEVDLLTEYLRLNDRAVYKIVKKWDKRTGSHELHDGYLQRFHASEFGFMQGDEVRDVRERVVELVARVRSIEPRAKAWRRTKAFTIGCFDCFHHGHSNLLTALRQFGSRVIVGIHDDESYALLKGAPPVDDLAHRIASVKPYVHEIFIIRSTDPTPFIQAAVSQDDVEAGRCVYVRGDDMPHFPARAWVESVMDVYLLPRTSAVSSSFIKAVSQPGLDAEQALAIAFAPTDYEGKPLLAACRQRETGGAATAPSVNAA